MTFITIDKRLVERNDLAFQDKYRKDSARHTPDAADKYETSEIEHNPICLYQKKMGLTGQTLDPAIKTES